MEPRLPFLLLPNELQMRVLRHVRTDDLRRIRAACTHTRDLVNHAGLVPLQVDRVMFDVHCEHLEWTDQSGTRCLMTADKYNDLSDEIRQMINSVKVEFLSQSIIAKVVRHVFKRVRFAELDIEQDEDSRPHHPSSLDWRALRPLIPLRRFSIELKDQQFITPVLQLANNVKYAEEDSLVDIQVAVDSDPVKEYVENCGAKDVHLNAPLDAPLGVDDSLLRCSRPTITFGPRGAKEAFIRFSKPFLDGQVEKPIVERTFEIVTTSATTAFCREITGIFMKRFGAIALPGHPMSYRFKTAVGTYVSIAEESPYPVDNHPGGLLTTVRLVREENTP